MSIEIKMPALSPTMEEGTLAKWLIKEGDVVKSGDLMAEIETDKATMEFEAVDEGTVVKILVAEGTDNVKVGTVIAIIAEEGEDASSISSAPTKSETPEPAAKESEAKPDPKDPNDTGSEAKPVERTEASAEDHGRPDDAGAAKPAASGDRVKASPLARRLAADKGIDLGAVSGSGPKGRIVKADVEEREAGCRARCCEDRSCCADRRCGPAPAAKPAAVPDIPHEATKLSNVRKTIARRLTESKQTVPHIYLTVNIRLDALLKLRGELNKSLEVARREAVGQRPADQGAGRRADAGADLQRDVHARPAHHLPACRHLGRGEHAVGPDHADHRRCGHRLAVVDLDADEGPRRPRSRRQAEARGIQGGTASICNLGMFGITQFDAVINPPQAMILAVGAGEKRPYVVDDELTVATVMSAHRQLRSPRDRRRGRRAVHEGVQALVENPLGMLA